MENVQLRQLIQKVTNDTFDQLALEVFQYQFQSNPIYQLYCRTLSRTPANTSRVEDIPFLPIQFFKSHDLKTGNWEEASVFLSSGTTGQSPSKHFIKSLNWYHSIALEGFVAQYGPVEQYCILALLPAYLERKGSSLVHMVHQFIQRSSWSESGFYLNDFASLTKQLKQCVEQGIPTILLGVSFALLDLAEQYPMDLSGVIIMETGGMKGRRKEIIRQDLHGILSRSFNTQTIHSEYGMTELLSQAYAPQAGLFYPIPTMRVLIRDVTDPFSQIDPGKTGTIDVIDLANIDTVSFIRTEDLGRKTDSGAFEVLGRLDNSDIRGCNLMIAN